jgi:MFS family permease
MKRTKLILPIIVVAQFFCTSIWFASNAVMGDLVMNFGINQAAIANLTSAVQFGVIIGTLVFALLALSDRFSPSKVFFISAILGALCNTGILWSGNNLNSILCLRFLTGFFLAGIYPVGIKIAADYFNKALGQSLGFLLAASVIGTAFPHLLKGLTVSFPWKLVVLTTSLLAILGGLMMTLLVPNGPYRKKRHGINLSAFFDIFRNQNLRSAAFGYFGHMWELYAFWAFTPLMLQTYANLHPETTFNIPVLSFFIIGIGSIACVLSGYLSQTFGAKRIAFISLLLSCACCLLIPFLFAVPSAVLFIAFMMFWGMVVIADSPLLSTLIAQSVDPEIKGTAITIVNSVGFTITIISIQLISALKSVTTSNAIYICLAIGPILGLLALRKKVI